MSYKIKKYSLCEKFFRGTVPNLMALSDLICKHDGEYIIVNNPPSIWLWSKTLGTWVESGEGSDVHNKGFFATQAFLIEEYPIATIGDYAIVINTDTYWVWDDEEAKWVDSGSGIVIDWGDISGTLINQTDLQDALDSKLDINKLNIYSTLYILKESIGTEPKIAYCLQNNTFYKYLINGSSFTANDEDITITGDGGNTRWIGFAGRYINGTIGLDIVEFDITLNNPAHKEGSSFYDKSKHALSYYNEVSDVTVNLGQELLIRVRNETGVPIPNGSVVYPVGVSDGRVLIDLADSSDKNKCRLVGVTTHIILDQTNGYVTKFGEVGSMDTSGFSVGNMLYLGTSPGEITTIKPIGSSFITSIAAVKTVDSVNGSIIVDINPTDFAVEVIQDTGWSPNNTAQIVFVDADDDDDLKRRLNITPLSGTVFIFYQYGDQYIKTSDSIQIPDEEGLYLIYYDLGILKYLKNPVNGSITTVMLQNPMVSYVYWNSVNKKHEFLGYKLHTIGMSCVTRSYLQSVLKTRYISGLTPKSILPDASGDINSHAQFGIEEGKIADEDLTFITPDTISTIGLPIAYLSGTSTLPTLRTSTNSGFSILNAVNGRMLYNTIVNGNWTLAQVASGDFACCHVVATSSNDSTKRLMAFIGQTTYGTIGTARSGAKIELMGLRSIVTFPQEVKSIATFIFQTSDSYTNAVKSRIRSVDTNVNYVDFRTTQIEGSETLAIQTHFQDNKTEIYDNSYPGRIMAFDVGTGWAGNSTRIFYMPDRNIDFNDIVVPVTITIGIETKVIDSFADTLLKAVRWDVTIYKTNGTAIRCSSINASWLSASNLIKDSGEIGSAEQGSTSDVTLTVSIISNIVTLSATSISTGWTISVKRYPIG